MFIAGFPKLTFTVLAKDDGDDDHRGPPTDTRAKKVSKSTKTDKKKHTF
jgi:hypothetical protein